MATTEELMAEYGVAWFGFDETSGNVYDKLGGNYVGTVYANATRVQGWDNKGNAMNFNRTSTSYIDFNDRIIPTSSYTLKFKMKLHTKPTSENQEIMCNSYLTADHIGLRVWIDTGGNLVFTSTRKSNNNYDFINSKQALFDNKWHEYMLTWDTNSKVVKLYEDEVFIRRVNSVTSNPTLSTYNLRIGNQRYSGQNRFFNGQIDDLQIYSKALTPSDLTQKRVAIKTTDNKNLVLSTENSRVKEIPSVDETDMINQGCVWKEVDEAVDRTGIDLTQITTEYEKVSKSNVVLGNGKMFVIPLEDDFKTILIEDNY